MKPTLFNLSVESDAQALDKLKKDGLVLHSLDTITAQLAELYAIEHPEDAFSPELKVKTESYIAGLGDLTQYGVWVYFPWNSTVVHVLPDAAFQKVRTARNRHLISEQEQQAFYNTVIGVAGLSVGNSVVLSIILQGGARRIKIADHDTLDLSNLNRIRAGVDALGIQKTEMTARQIYALNPYAEVEVYPDGLTDDTKDQFFDGLDIVIDEIDSLAVKVTIREEAKKRKLPVLMAADNDASGVFDIERYDVDPDLVPFHGRLGTLTKDDLSKLDKRGIGRTIAQLVGLENHTPRMLRSLQEMGKSIVSWPQLGGTALLNGSLVAYAAFRIANNLPVVDTRVIVDMARILDAAYDSPAAVAERTSTIDAFKKMLGL